jgi:hypothetical protein
MTLLTSDCSICNGCRICWCMICAKNRWNMHKPCSPSCMLSNKIVALLLNSWWIVVFLEYITTSYMDSIERWCDHKAETWCSEHKILVSHHLESEQLLCCRETPKWYQNEQQLFYDKYIHSTWTNNLSWRKESASKTTCESFRQLLSSHKSDLDRLARRTWYTPYSTPTLFVWFGSNYFYLFPTVKEKLERIRIADEDQFSESLQEILRDVDRQKLNCVFQAWVKQVQEVSSGNGDYVR